MKDTPQDTQVKQVIRFATFEVDLRSGEVRKGGTRLKLSGQPFQVLTILLEQPGHVVTREELQKRLWPDTFVDVEHSLNAAVNRIREVLGDTAENPRFVETIPRRGYRFIAQVMNGDKDISAEMERVRKEAQADTTDETANPRSARNAWLVRGMLAACVLIAAGGWLAYRNAMRDVTRLTLQRNLTRITFDEGLQIGATWSPDRRYIAYSSTRGGKSDIWVQQVSGGNAIRVTTDNGNNWQPDWSPDGKYIAYRSEEGDGGLFVVPALGGAGMQRRISGFGAYPRWSPDSRQILFQSTGFGVPCKVFVVDANGGKRPQEVLPGIAVKMQVMSAMWHPDGKRVSVWGWTTDVKAIPSIWTGPVNGGDAPVLTDVKPEILKMAEAAAGSGMSSWADTDLRFAWAPAGNAIYFERSFRGAKNIWRMTVDPSTLRATGMERLTTGSEGEVEFALSADGSKVAFTSQSEQLRAWMFPLDAARGKVTGAGQAVTSPGQEAWEGSLSPDGKKLAYASKRGGKWEIWEKSFVDGSELPIAADDMYVRNEPQWSPDGSRLAYARQVPSTGKQQLVTWDSKSRKEEAVTALTHKFLLTFDWSPDGKWLLASEQNEEGGQTEIWTEPVPDTGSDRVGRRKIVAAETGNDLWQGRYSPNGKWIAFENVRNKPEGFESAIFVFPAAGGEWVRITEGKHWDDKPRWSPDGKIIYFLSDRGGYFNVFGRRFDDAAGKVIGETYQVTQFHDPTLMIPTLMPTAGLAVSQDRLMVTVSQGSGSIWVLDGVDR